MIRVQIPFHLRTLANITGDIELEVEPPVTIASVLDALARRMPSSSRGINSTKLQGRYR